MNIADIETIPFFENIEAKVTGSKINTGLYKLFPNPMRHNFILDMGNKNVVEVDCIHKQDKTELDAQFCRSKTNVCRVKHCADGNILFDVYFFAGIIDDFRDMEILTERNKIGAFQNKERKPDFEEVCKSLPEKCALTVSGEDFFIIQADFSKPNVSEEVDSETDADEEETSSATFRTGAFAILCGHKGKCHAIKVHQKSISSAGDQTYFYVSGIASRRNIQPAGNFHLIKANLTFSDQKKAASEFNKAKLAQITESNGSYLKAWREYSGARGDRVLKTAREFGSVNYESISKEAGTAKLYFKHADGEKSISERVSESAVEEIIIFKNSEPLPLFLQDKKCDFLSYCEKKAEIKKQNKGGKKKDELVFEVLDSKDNWIEIRPVGEKISVDDIPEKGFAIMSMTGEESQIQRQMEAWKNIAEGKAGIVYLGNLLEGNFDIIGNVQRQKEFKITERIRKKIFKNPPTERQMDAIKIALLTPDIALIQGPPGTGKTTVLTAILEILNEMQDKRSITAGRVLISAYQHDAVYNMILDDKGKPRITVNSLPTWKYGSRRNGGGSYNEHIEQWCRDIEDKVLALNPNVQVSSEEELFHAYTAEYIYAPDSENRRRLLEYILGSLPITTELADRARKLNTLSEREAGLSEENPALMRKIRALRTTEKSFADDGVKRAEDLYFALEGIKFFQTNKETESLLMKAVTEKPSDSTFSELAELKNMLLESFSKPPRYVKPEADQTLVDLCKDIANYLEQQRGKKDKKEQIIAEWVQDLQAGKAAFSRAIKDCDFAYAATTQQAEGSDLRKQKKLLSGGNIVAAQLYDTVIIDEAARATPPDLLIPMCKAAKRIILVGDHRQLPQLVDDDICNEVYEKNKAAVQTEQSDSTQVQKADEDEKFDYKSAYKLSLFELLFKKLKELEEKDGIKRTATLDKQFRTHPLLGEFCSKMFYDPHGEHYDSPRPASDFSYNLPGIENKAAVWIDVASSVGREAKIATGSWTRECEADCIVSKLLEFAKSQADIPDDKKLSYGIISFYKGQKELIEKKLNGRKTALKGIKYKVGTVDAFQGMEFDIVFLSVVRTNKIAQYGFLTSFNRMCVSMSRQKKALIVVGDSAFVTTDKARKSNAIPALAEFYDLCADNTKNKGFGAVLEWKK